MTNKLTQKHTELSWEEAVAKYLEEHPDFFQHHPELLERLTLPHVEAGGAVSLIERQVSALRERNESLQKQLQDLVTIARDNEILGERVHHFSLSLADAGSLDDILSSAQDTLRREFRLDASVLLLRRPEPDEQGRSEFANASDRRFGVLLKRIGMARTVCDDALEPELLDYLFGHQTPPILSVALIPLGGATPWGVLGLGAQDPERFLPDMGTVYLGRLGEVLTRALQRFL
jgi:uncharacterized protein YigA (DUF484 family)